PLLEWLSLFPALDFLVQFSLYKLNNGTNWCFGQLLNCTENITLLRSEYGQLKLFMNATLYNLTLMSSEKTQLSMLLKNTMQEKTHLQVRNKELNMLLKSTMENYSLVEEEKRQLNLHLNKSLQIITTETAENKQNQKHTLHCSRCLPGWVEHASRCFFLSSVAEKWEVARQLCISMGGDLAIVLNAEDQAFLTNMTFQYVQAHPQEDFHSAWIGLQDMVKEGTHLWVNGNTIKWDVIYWKESEPNNAVPDWDTDLSGQDCVAIVPPRGTGGKDWLNSWDDIICGGKRHYLCETMKLNKSL
uniref:C-type lectin domain-containing protein n=1 Tax=Seriola dumerili TaxID=41447 RepID=A0A3B4TLP9_SERDU